MFKCPMCDGRSCYRVDDVEIEGWRRGYPRSFDNMLRGTAVVCVGCSRLDFYVHDAADWAKRIGGTLCGPEAGGSPYR